MKPAQIVVDVVDAGGAIWVEAGHLKAKHPPEHLIPHIRKHKLALLALLSSSEYMDTISTPKYDDPETMTETLLTTLRAIGIKVSITYDNRLKFTPEDALWDYDVALIAELEPHLIALLGRDARCDRE